MDSMAKWQWWRHMSGRWITLSVLVALGGLAFLTASWPAWTQRYVQALAWPAVALLAIAAFGPALARRVPALTSLQLPGGLVATFEEQTFELESTYAELTASEAWGPVIDEAQLDLTDAMPDLRSAELEAAQEGIRTLGSIVAAYQVQLDFLRTLTVAEGGLTHAAARGWFADALATRGADPASWDLEALINWLLGQGAISLLPDGTYRPALHGHRIVAALDLPGLFVAPKII